MRRYYLILAGVLLATGCERFVVRTDNRVAFAGPVDTRVTTELPPVSPNAGPVRPVVVTPGSSVSRVALVDVDGLILNTPFAGFSSLGENPVALFRERLDAAEADPCVKAVVVRINSHGGGVAACIAMRRDLERFKSRCGKPVVAALLDTACGGAYYLASAADQVVATEGTVTGGVGVVLNLFNLQDLMAQFNVIPQSIKAGDKADIGSSARPIQPEEKQLLQAMADEFHGRLVADVRKSRPAARADVFDGRILTGTQAKAQGLVDQIGDLDHAVAVAAGLGCGDGFRPQVVMYRRANDPAHSVYAVTANVPLQGAGLLPNIPGLDRSKLPTFLSLWQPELTMEKLGGK
ncbi:Putative signal peptide peptidase SppA [Urbifossiella limnaea]|uniref:Signal peptide peptidase SppA n=1 Tax=Urbifossiella limnaea TaxID=2528023 RepID=A0A517XU81_9BACT|nr:Putative signal peptide peptidase SppA [Urbifossiella limnaea]